MKTRKWLGGPAALLGLGAIVAGAAVHGRGLIPGTQRATEAAPGAASTAQLSAHLMKEPLAFEPNRGQSGKEVKFLSRGNGFSTFVTPTSRVISLFGKRERDAKGSYTGQRKVASVKVDLVGANRQARAEALDRLPGKTNYLLGNDPDKWVTDVPTYQKVKFASVYDGVDVYYYGRGQTLEYDMVVAPGADPDQIRIGCSGASSVRLDEGGDLLLQTSVGTVRQEKPEIYQVVDGVRRKVDGRYEFVGGQDRQVRIALGAYDRTAPLVIDPLQRIYLTYLGGGSNDFGTGIATDTSGNAYVHGSTSSSGFFLSGFESTVDHLYVTKFDSAGSRVWSTYLGGTANSELPGAIAVDPSAQPVIVASTQSGNGTLTAAAGQPSYPTTVGAFQRHKQGGYDACLTKLNANGNGLVYSTLISGTAGNGDDRGLALALNAAGDRAYVVGRTNTDRFPAYPATFNPSLLNGFQTTRAGNYDAFLIVLKMDSANAIGPSPTQSYTDASGTSDYADMVYATLIGGTADEGTSTVPDVVDMGLGVAVDSAGNAYVCGDTVKPTGVTNFQNSTTGAYRRAYYNSSGGDVDAFVVKVSPALTGSSSLIFGTLVGAVGTDVATDIGVDSSGQPIVVGYTTSSGSGGTGSFPTQNAVFSTFRGGLNDGFLTRFNAAGTALVYSTYLGGSGSDQAYGVKVDAIGNAYLIGRTDSTAPNNPSTFPQVQNTQIQVGYQNNGDAYIEKFRPDGSGPIFSSYFGGTGGDYGQMIAVDTSGNAYVTGYTGPGQLPVLNAYQATYQGSTWDAFVGKFKLNDAPQFTTASPNSVSTPCTAGGQSYSWSLDVYDENSDNLQVEWSRKGPSDGSFTVVETDNIAGPAVVLGPPSVVTPTTGTASYSTTVSAIGTTSFKATLTDGLATVVYSWSVTINDNDPPVITGAVGGSLGTLTLNPTNPPTCDRFVGTLTVPAATDCQSVTVTGTIADPDGGGPTNNGDTTADTTEYNQPAQGTTWTFKVGETYVVTWTAKDASNNSAVATQTIVVSDSTAPLLTIPGDVTVPADNSEGADLTTTELKITPSGYTVSDNCGTPTVIAFRDNPWRTGDGDDATDDNGQPLDLNGWYPLGRSLITWIAYDGNLNYTELYQEIYVEGSTTVTSPFTSDGESWTTYGTDVTAPTYSAAGGQSGGYIYASQPNATSSTWFFEAPSKFYGNKLGLYNQTLTFYLKINGTVNAGTNQGVVLSGGGLTIYTPMPSSPTSGSWTAESVTVAAGTWKVDDGDGILAGDATASLAQIQTVLGSLTSLKIQGKFDSTAGATTQLDTVVMNLNYLDPTPAPPSPLDRKEKKKKPAKTTPKSKKKK